MDYFGGAKNNIKLYKNYDKTDNLKIFFKKYYNHDLLMSVARLLIFDISKGTAAISLIEKYLDKLSRNSNSTTKHLMNDYRE